MKIIIKLTALIVVIGLSACGRMGELEQVKPAPLTTLNATQTDSTL
ncbi:hypothetical protein THERMOT_1642 [Bathymodiolus thermophilus thioautotrophic gill symbiont]|uniref:Lipoprotein n=1 Tax=Bathymodiolus thermophilus thioautotrophic gill symbiont TaxID=2360 RepID=A0A3G3IPN1_9GAMM|nr:hypothetical protein [Bathymodiolus thermophilus thioautotrophic gill symbiont]AYQ57649.1 hypothetical protein MS2017_1991 [Bathymodiolus thermophilus thioautotrophic gill symbiont]CAB5497036.1 hypothetical protein THERMOS_611 [Bathymodiolus thermophilus thioautotrophic gill symbiont]CAB5502566.1 hypothetical protein THERMOT_1642 [Bathymodiolus thermophilus thioautotrophic gill symbiont]